MRNVEGQHPRSSSETPASLLAVGPVNGSCVTSCASSIAAPSRWSLQGHHAGAPSMLQWIYVKTKPEGESASAICWLAMEKIAGTCFVGGPIWCVQVSDKGCPNGCRHH